MAYSGVFLLREHLPLFGRIYTRFPRYAKDRFRRRSGNRSLAEMFPKDIAPIAI